MEQDNEPQGCCLKSLRALGITSTQCLPTSKKKNDMELYKIKSWYPFKQLSHDNYWLTLEVSSAYP